MDQPVHLPTLASETSAAGVHSESQRQTPPARHPAVIDRCLQAMVKNALEPSWEARFEGSSYGFRPGRGCHDAIEKIYGLARPHTRKKWVVDADIKGAFDNIYHDFLLNALGVPGQGTDQAVAQGRVHGRWSLHDTAEGTPQGGVISPCC